MRKKKIGFGGFIALCVALAVILLGLIDGTDTYAALEYFITTLGVYGLMTVGARIDYVAFMKSMGGHHSW